jgi:hypothetical protein
MKLPGQRQATSPQPRKSLVASTLAPALTWAQLPVTSRQPTSPWCPATKTPCSPKLDVRIWTGIRLELNYKPLIKTQQQATDIYNKYLDDLQVQGPDVQRHPVQTEPIPQGSGHGVGGHQWVMAVCSNGQSRAMGSYPVYDPRLGKVGSGALSQRLQQPVQEVREQHKVKVVIEVLRLNSMSPCDQMPHLSTRSKLPGAASQWMRI